MAMIGTSDYLENKILNHVLRGVTYTSSSSVYLALYTSDPGEDDSGTELPDNNGYERILLTEFSSKTGGALSDAEFRNVYDIFSATATGSGWDEVTHIGIQDKGTTPSNLLFYGELSSPVTIATGQQFAVPAGELAVYLTPRTKGYLPVPGYSYYLSKSLLDHILNNVSFTSPGLGVYAALYITLPTADDTGGIEVSADGYSRIRISGTSDWTTPSSGSTGNVSAKVFTSDASEDWGTISGVGLRTASSGGYLLFRASLNPSKTVYEGDGFKFAAKALKILID
jgi:hypothetical protein